MQKTLYTITIYLVFLALQKIKYDVLYLYIVYSFGFIVNEKFTQNSKTKKNQMVYFYCSEILF